MHAQLTLPIKLVLAALVSLATAYATMAVDRDRNAQTRSDVAQMKAAAPADAAWRQHVDDRIDRVDEKLDYLIQASKR